MNITKSTAGINPRVKLSLSWVFVVLLMFYADIVSLMDPTSMIRERMVGTPMSAGFLLGRRSSNDNFDSAGYPVLGIELQSKSLGKRCYWSFHDSTNYRRRARSVLYLVCNRRSCLYIDNYLVYLEMETCGKARIT